MQAHKTYRRTDGCGISNSRYHSPRMLLSELQRMQSHLALTASGKKFLSNCDYYFSFMHNGRTFYVLQLKPLPNPHYDNRKLHHVSVWFCEVSPSKMNTLCLPCRSMRWNLCKPLRRYFNNWLSKLNINAVCIQGGSNMTGTCAACLHTNQSRSYLNHLVYTRGI